MTSDGANGDPFASVGFAETLNVDTGVVDASSTGSYQETLARAVVTQSNGTSVAAFDFTNFTLSNTLNLVGSMPVAFVATGNIDITGALNAGGGPLIGIGAGGFAGASGCMARTERKAVGRAGQGGGGIGLGGYVGSPCCGYSRASEGGGGGSASPGQPGVAGYLFPSNAINGNGGIGGSASFALDILQGGGGGGSGGWGFPYAGDTPVKTAARVGGALLLETPGSITIGTNGVVKQRAARQPGLRRSGRRW